MRLDYPAVSEIGGKNNTVRPKKQDEKQPERNPSVIWVDTLNQSSPNDSIGDMVFSQDTQKNHIPD
jgi:hypothetical protein